MIVSGNTSAVAGLGAGSVMLRAQIRRFNGRYKCIELAKSLEHLTQAEMHAEKIKPVFSFYHTRFLRVQSWERFTLMFHKQHGKEKLMVLNYTQFNRNSTISWISPLVDSKDGVDFAMLLNLWASSRFIGTTTQELRKAGGLQILCGQWFAVAEYSLIFDASRKAGSHV